MPRGRPEKKQSTPCVSLHISASAQDNFLEVFRPWFETHARAAWQRKLPTVVAVPFRSQAYALKKCLLDAGISILGIRFLTAAQLRELVGERTGMKLALREHLRLLLAVAAETAMKLPDDPVARAEAAQQPDYLAAKSVRRAPDHLLRTLDQLGAAGWKFSALNLPALRDIVARFERQLERCDFELIHAADRRASEQAKHNPPLIASLLVAGFNGAHWPLWPLLQAAVSSAVDATVVLDDPRDEARDLDEAWVGTWEESFGEAKRAMPPRRAGETLFSEAEMRGAAATAPVPRSFLIGANAAEQAEAVAQQCLQFLMDPEGAAIGIVFPGPGALPRLVAETLVRRKIPHHDAIAHWEPGPFEAADWKAWLNFQEEPRIASLLQFVNTLGDCERILPALRPKFERTLRSVYAELLIDDLEVLKQFCAAQPDEEDQAAASVLASIPLLPARATLADFLRATKDAFDHFEWKARWAELSPHLGNWTERLREEFSCGLYLRWLDEMAATFTVARAPDGDHPYAQVQLLMVPQAQNQHWSHLIFAGWNEGAWPTRERGDFARADEIEAFNRDIRKINLRAVRQGRQGEGHVTVQAGHTLYLGPAEQNQIELRQFEALLELVSQKVAFSASLVKEDAPERLWNPSELFTRHYQASERRPLTQEAIHQLHARTRQWLGQPQRKPAKEVEQTRVAYDARRDPTSRSGEYDFAFRAGPPRVPTLSVSDFEQLMSAPAVIWLKKYVGVKAAEENINVWNTSSGKWVHDWLAAIIDLPERTFGRAPTGADMDNRICAAAETKRAQVTALCRAANKSLPDWWVGGWRNALFLARSLGDKLGTVSGWPWLATEWTVSGAFPIEGSEAALSLSGRIDLLLARSETPAGSLKAEELWIVDYKTGAKKALSPGSLNEESRRPGLKKRLLDGTALQLGLYALAARALGAGGIHVSLLSPLVRPLQPQVSASDFSSEQEIFTALAEMQQTGIFGMRGQLRSAFRFTDDYPLATLAIDTDILDQRWELTHPALARDDEEFWG